MNGESFSSVALVAHLIQGLLKVGDELCDLLRVKADRHGVALPFDGDAAGLAEFDLSSFRDIDFNSIPGFEAPCAHEVDLKLNFKDGKLSGYSACARGEVLFFHACVLPWPVPVPKVAAVKPKAETLEGDCPRCLGLRALMERFRRGEVSTVEWALMVDKLMLMNGPVAEPGAANVERDPLDVALDAELAAQLPRPMTWLEMLEAALLQVEQDLRAGVVPGAEWELLRAWMLRLDRAAGEKGGTRA